MHVKATKKTLRYLSHLSMTKRWFSKEIPSQPSKAFLALKKNETQLNTNNVQVSDLNHISNGLIHPSYYVFTSRLQPNLDTKITRKLKSFKQEMLMGLSKEITSDLPLTLTIKPGSFYFPFTTHAGKNAIEKASDEQIAHSECLLGFPIFVRKEDEIIATIEQYCRLLGFSNIAQMQQAIPNGVVAYVVNNHSRLIEELRTLQYLEQNQQDHISLQELGYQDVYSRFIEPKLMRDQKLVNAQDFCVNMLTASYTNRLFDMSMGMIYEAVLKAGGNPQLFLENCYGFHMLANPYNFTKQCMEASDWRAPVLKQVSSDIIWNFSDIATRINPEHELLLCHFRKFGNNVMRLSKTKRQATIIVPDVIENYQGMSPSQTGAALLGHDLAAAIDKLNEQEPHIVHNLKNYLTKKISKSKFDLLRYSVDYVYKYDPSNGVPINQLLHSEELSKSELIIAPMLSIHLVYDLFAMVMGDFPPIDEPYYHTYRILDKTNEYLKFGVKVAPFTDTMFSFKPFDLLHFPDKHGHVVVREVLIQQQLTKLIYKFLEKNPEKKQILKTFFTTIWDQKNWRAAEENTTIFRLGLIKLDIDHNIKLAKDYASWSIPSHTLPTHLKNDSAINPKFCVDLFVLAEDILRMQVYTREMLEEEYAEKNKVIKLKDERMEILYTDEELFIMAFKQLCFDSQLNLTDGKMIIWECVMEAVKTLLHSGDPNEAYCALLSTDFAYTVGLKLRAATQSYTFYQQYLAQVNKDLAEEKKIKPIEFKKILLGEQLPDIKVRAYQLINESGDYTKTAIPKQNSRTPCAIKTPSC